ncbi:ABC superfamily ATP binding cassette transporter, solute-binding protein, partial [human gut metagenome]
SFETEIPMVMTTRRLFLGGTASVAAMAALAACAKSSDSGSGPGSASGGAQEATKAMNIHAPRPTRTSSPVVC